MSTQDDRGREDSSADGPLSRGPSLSRRWQRSRSSQSSQRGQSGKGDSRKLLWGGILGTRTALYVAGVILVIGTLLFWKHGFPQDIWAWFNSAYLLLLFSALGVVFLIVLRLAIQHIRDGIRQFKGEEPKGRHRNGDAKNPRKWWINWLLILLVLYGFVLTLFATLFLYYFLPQSGPFGLFHFNVAHLGGFLIALICAGIGLGFLVDSIGKVREKRYLKSLLSLLGVGALAALSLWIAGMVVPPIVSSVPEIFTGPKTIENAQCLSSRTERGVDGDGRRNPMPRREYTQYHFIVAGQGAEPFEFYLTAYDDEGPHRIAETIQGACASKEPFTLVHYPVSKVVVDAR
ncbi:MAG: hypothetical protein Q4C87_06165 [Actinomycetaceae bacterium]|nr:hypothetical protein [Actinomycetaceae bacterium]